MSDEKHSKAIAAISDAEAKLNTAIADAMAQGFICEVQKEMSAVAGYEYLRPYIRVSMIKVFRK